MSRGRQLTRRKRIAFRLALISLPIGLLLVGEVLARWLAPARADDPFVHMAAPQSVFGEVERDGIRYYQVTHPEAYSANNTAFPVQKPPGGLRIFCLGGSASAGWPHPGAEAYPAYLQQALDAAFPDREVEVLNVGAHAYAAYRVRHICDDVVRFDPDLLIIWSGNNEFVEKRSYFAGSRLVATTRAIGRHSRLIGLLSDVVGTWLNPANSLSDARNDSGFFIWSQVEQVSLELRADPQQLAEVESHYEFSIESMVEAAEQRGIPVLLSTVPVNLRDWIPNVSVHSPEADLDGWRESFAEGFRLLAREQFADAAAVFERAAVADPLHAETRFLFGRALEGAGQRDLARDAYRAARDLDHNPFRASTSLNQIVRSIAARHEGVQLLDLERHFDDLATAAAPGFDLFLDYVHPTKSGNLAVSRKAFATILDSGVLGVIPATREFTYRDSGYTDETNVPLYLHVLVLRFVMHQYASFCETGDLLVALLERDGSSPATAPIVDLVRRCQQGLRHHLDQRRRFFLGEPSDPDFEVAHKEFYRRMFAEMTSLAQSAR